MFNLTQFPADTRGTFHKGGLLWPLAVDQAIDGGIKNVDDLTNLVFFMHHPERMTGHTGRALDPKETNFQRLADEWTGFRTMVKPMVTAPSSGKMTSTQRAKVVETAKSLHNEGCHFVNGGRGDRPEDTDTPLGGPQDSVVLEKMSLLADHPNVQTARSWKEGAICKGRFGSVGGKKFSDVLDPDLKDYLKRMRTVAAVTPHEDLPPLTLGPLGHRLTPRTVNGKIILGESCVGKRHFDCIDLVNYCYSVALGKRWQFDLKQYDAGLAGATAKAIKVNLRDADIVLRDISHSGIVYKADKGQWRVIECPGGKDGCVDSVFTESDWTKRVRMR